VAVAQINTIVGDLDGNTEKIIDYIGRAKEIGADVVTFPELAITGYPPEDLLLKNGFVARNMECLDRIVEATSGITAIVGFVDLQEDIFNSAAVVSDGRLMGVHHKFFLPNYGVFDEDRYFQAGTKPRVYDLGGVIFGVEVCEDSWFADGPHRVEALVGNAQVVFVINSSPFSAGKWQFREQMLATRASDNSCFFVYGNLVGGQDELVFDGHSLVFGPDGRVICRGPVFEEGLVVTDIDVTEVLHRRLVDTRRRKDKERVLDSGYAVERIKLPSPVEDSSRPEITSCMSDTPGRVEEVYKALLVGVRDYVEKNGFKKVVLGVSGGIDSALTAAIAVDALGKDRVVGVVMPSQFSSDATQGDAVDLCKLLGMQHYYIPIETVFESYKSTLADAFAGTEQGVAEENLQARTRGNILMALSNKFGWLVLTTGNKSELATGYSTLYGDMAGGFNILKDVPKMLVYELSRYRNDIGPVIPVSIIDRPPSAELRPDQKDEDSLPPYSVLDPIIHAYVEDDKSTAEMAAMGFDQATIERIVKLIDRNEYKRRQSAPGIKITTKAFGKDRRLPITNKYRE
jgi:NAD+ synthase (glutamine-hydrolysing)